MSLLDRIRRRPAENGPLTADRLIAMVDKGRVDPLLDALRELPEGTRRDLGTALVAHVRAGRDGWWNDASVTAVAVAAVGCLPSAAQAAALLARTSLRWPWITIPAAPVLCAAADRRIEWVGDFALRMAAKLDREVNGGGWWFVNTLLTATGTTPPTDDRFVQGWVAHTSWSPDGRVRRLAVADQLRNDPHLDLLLPRIFEVDGLGLTMLGFNWTNPDTGENMSQVFPAALAQLAADGRLERGALIDGCLARFLRGDRPSALRAFVRLHDLLAPTAEEAGARAHDYVRLLPAAPSQVAALAQRMLRAAAEAGRVEFDTVLDAGRIVLGRPEKALVRAQLGWFDKLARRESARVDEVLGAVAVAFAHPELDLQERALGVAARHVRAAGPAGITALRDAASGLGADLRSRAVELFGSAPPGDDAPTVTAVAAGVPAPLPVAPMPPPIASVDELAEEVAALCAGQVTAVPLDRVLDALVRFTAADDPALRPALAPVIERYADALDGHDDWSSPGCPHAALGAALRVASGSGPQAHKWEQALRAPRDSRLLLPTTLPLGRNLPNPHAFLLIRIAEVALRLRHAPVPSLVATATLASGSLDAAVLLDRLVRAEREGWQPLPVDLTQALLRLPRSVPADVGTAAGALRSPAGLAFARWLAHGGLPDPIVTRAEVPGPVNDSTHWRYGRLPRRRVLVGLAPPPGFHDEFGLLTLAAPAKLYGSPPRRGIPTLWPAVLPAHPDVIAAHALPEIAATADIDQRSGAEVLPMLAESGAAPGHPIALALGYALAARHDSDRAAAVDAVLGFAAANGFDGGPVGDELGRLAAGGLVKLNRANGALADVVRGGAPAAAWQIIAGALPHLMPVTPAPRGLPDLLALGAQTAAASGIARTGVTPDGLAQLAQRPGTSRLVTEARRLTRVLSPESVTA